MDKLPTLPNPTLNPSLATLPNHKLLHIHPSLLATLRNLPATLNLSLPATLLSLKVTRPSSPSPNHSSLTSHRNRSHNNPT